MKEKLLKTFCVVLALIAFVLMAIGSGSETTSEQTEAGNNVQSSQSASEQTQSSSNKTEFRVGETLQTNSLKITFLSSGEYISDNMFIQPKEGNKYVYIKLYCENTSPSDHTISYFDFDCYADGYSCEQTYSLDDSLSASLSSGRSTTGRICFEVPTDAKTIEFEYEENILFSQKYKFIFEGEKDSGIAPSGDVKETENAHSVGGVVETQKEKITYISTGDYVSDNMFLQPKEGDKYIYLEFEFENISKSDISVSSFDFNCFADGTACESSYVGDDMLSATISQGRKAKGKIYFEVPISAKIIEVEYSTSLLTSSKIVFKVK